MDGVEAFVKDMENLGVDVDVAVVGDPLKLAPQLGVKLLAVLTMNLGEDLEAEKHVDG